jgi:hypothetical protein
MNGPALRFASLGLAALAASACAKAPATTPQVVAVTQVPAGAAGFEPLPRSRYPEGSRIVLADLAHPDVAPRPLTDGLAAAGAPSVRADGTRIAFVASEKPGDPFTVWTCGPDGSDRAKAFESAADCGSAAFLPDGRLVYSMSVGSSGQALFVTNAKGGPAQRITFSGGVDTDPTMLRDGRVAFACRPAGAKDFALWAVHVDGTGVSRYEGPQRTRALLVAETDEIARGAWTADASRRAIELTPVVRGVRPQGHLSVVDPAKPAGAVFCVDARPAGVAAAHGVRFVVLEETPVSYGDAPLETDGSFFARVPADTPLGLELLDAEGRVIASQHAPFWVRPGETRGCIGCHEDQDTTPPNVRPIAILGQPVPVGRERVNGGSR